MQSSSTNRRDDDLVTGRGPVSGSGDPLSDQDALAILDERVESHMPEVAPDIGVVVIDRSEPEVGPAQGQQHLGLGEEAEKAVAVLIEDLHSQPWSSELDWGSLKQMLEPSAPRCIVRAGLETSLPVLIDTSCRKLGAKPLYFSPGASMRLRVLLDDSTFDVSLSSHDLDEPDLTIRDLLGRAGRPDR
jgi:hypothetical protein